MNALQKHSGGKQNRSSHNRNGRTTGGQGMNLFGQKNEHENGASASVIKGGKSYRKRRGSRKSRRRHRKSRRR